MRSQVEAFRLFHGVDPSDVEEFKCWLPGELVLMGVAIDTGYTVTVKDSEKEYNQQYVHDHRDDVLIYRRAKDYEPPDRVMRVHKTCWLLGKWLGASFVDERGRIREVSGRGMRAISPTKKILFALGGDGVRYVIMGGKFRITDWMYD